jgi:hypothetical protein
MCTAQMLGAFPCDCVLAAVASIKRISYCISLSQEKIKTHSVSQNKSFSLQLFMTGNEKSNTDKSSMVALKIVKTT